MQNQSKHWPMPVPEFAKFPGNPYNTPSKLRALIFKEHENGLAKSGAILRVGRKVLIDPMAFMDWLFSQGSTGRPAEKIKKPIELRLDDATRDYLQKAAEVHGLPVAKYAARLIEAGLKEAV